MNNNVKKTAKILAAFRGASFVLSVFEMIRFGLITIMSNREIDISMRFYDI